MFTYDHGPSSGSQALITTTTVAATSIIVTTLILVPISIVGFGFRAEKISALDETLDELNAVADGDDEFTIIQG